MSSLIALLLVAVGLAFLVIEQALLGGLCILGGLLMLAARLFLGTGKAVKAATTSVAKSVADDVSKADTSGPEMAVMEKGLENAGDLAGQQMFAKDKHQFKFKGAGGISGACQGIIDLFKKMFK